MKLPEGLKQAASIGASEVLFEWLEAISEDPLAVIEGDDLGSTFQSYLSPDVLSEVEARQLLGELTAWDPGSDDGTHAGAVDRYAQAQLAAGLDIGRALIALAHGLDKIPAPLQPHAAALAPLVELLREALDNGEFDESVDINEIIWS